MPWPSINNTASFGLADSTCNGVCITSLTDCPLDWLLCLTGRAWSSLVTFTRALKKSNGSGHCLCVPKPTFVFLFCIFLRESCLFGRMCGYVCACYRPAYVYIFPVWQHKKRWEVCTINLHSVIYEGVRLSGIQWCLVQLILLCWRGEPQGICASCHLPSLLIALSYSDCCRQQPRGMAERGRQKTK